MRKTGLVILGLLLFSLPPLLAAEDGYYRYQFARVQYVQGDVVLQKAAGEEEAAEVNLAIAEGNILLTKEGRAEVYLGRGNDLRLDRWTSVEFSRLPQTEGDKTSLRILEGSVYLRVRNLLEEKNYEVHTGDASFYILEDGLYRFDVSAEETEVVVLEGAVEAAGDERSVILERNERIVAASGELGATMRTALEKDSFAQWNDEREAQEKRASSRYLPAELAEYEAELETGGRWVYERPWGYVWVPYIIYSDWRPYYYGHWTWYPVIGWTWVPYEPWGWCVFHFGRWHWRFGLGWYWIPTTYWGPAWVHWWSAYDYLGWVPLSYYNRPVVIVNNYFYDRFYDSVYPVYSRALTVIRKDQLRAPRVHEVALQENQLVRLSNLSLRAVRTEELNSLVRPESLRALPANPSISRPGSGTPSSGLSTEGKVIRREGLLPGSTSPELKSGGSQTRPTPEAKDSSVRPARLKSEPSGVSTRHEPVERSINSNRPGVAPVERRIRSESSSSGIKVSPSGVRLPKEERPSSPPSPPVRKKDEENERPSRITSDFGSPSIRESRVEGTYSRRTSPTTYFRSKLAEKIYPSRSQESTSVRSGGGSVNFGSWRSPTITRLPSASSPRVSVPSFGQRSSGMTTTRISPPSFSSPRPSSPHSSAPSSGRIIKKK